MGEKVDITPCRPASDVRGETNKSGDVIGWTLGPRDGLHRGVQLDSGVFGGQLDPPAQTLLWRHTTAPVPSPTSSLLGPGWGRHGHSHGTPTPSTTL